MSRMMVGVAVGLWAAMPAAANTPDGLPTGKAAYAALSASNADPDQQVVLGPDDVINITVFQEPDLAMQDLAVDSSGMILIPLIGSVRAQGQTATQLGQTIADLLGKKYLNDPQVSVTLKTSASQRVTVEGAVTDPGVYQINGRTTLVDAISMAKGPTQVAKLTDVAIFRVVDGRPVGAVFDIRQIRRGEAADPDVMGRDRIVVGQSGRKAAWRDFIQSAGFLNAIATTTRGY